MSWRVIVVQMGICAEREKTPAMGRTYGGTEDRDDFQEDHEKSRAVGHELDFRLAKSRPDRDRLEAHAVAGLDEGQRRCGRRGKTVGEKVKKLSQAARPRRT